MKEEKNKKNEEEKSLEVIKEDKMKKKWLINTSTTILLVAIIIATFIAITVIMQKIDITPIDLTDDQLYTLTEESKEQIRNINKEINIYFVGEVHDNPNFDLAKQYEKENGKINVQEVTVDTRPDLAQKYGIDRNSEGIIVESDKKFKVLAMSDLYTYDYTTYETISIAEEKLTAAIKSVAAEQLPKVYFLSGYSSFSLSNGMQYLGIYLENEVNEIEVLDILSKGKVPDDCNTLVIMTPEKDFDDIATNAIIDYINNGGNILWFNAAITQNIELTNVNKILATYGVQPFEVGIIRETDISKMVEGSPDLIMPVVEYSDVTSKLTNTEGILLINATKINMMDMEELSNLNILRTDLITTSDNAYFRSNFAIVSDDAVSGESKEKYLLGVKLEKEISDEKTSQLILYGENFFISDYQLTPTTYTPMIAYRKNKDLALNSIAYLSDREEDITVRKATGSITYTATEQEHRIILTIIIAIPVLIIIAGVVVWIIRRRKK